MKTPVFYYQMLVGVSVMFCFSWVTAQVDPSTALLFKQNAIGGKDAGLNTGRYTIKKGNGPVKSTDNQDIKVKLKKVGGGKLPAKKAKTEVVRPVTDEDVPPIVTKNEELKPTEKKEIKEVKAAVAEERESNKESNKDEIVVDSKTPTVPTTITTPIIPATPEQTVDSKKGESAVKPIGTEVETAENKPQSTERVAIDKNKERNNSFDQSAFMQIGELDPEAPITIQFRDIVLGGSRELLDGYQKTLHPDDIRNNKIEIELLPMFIYNDSNSIYWYRKYYTFSQGIHFGTKLWLTPFFGLNVKYLSSIGGDVFTSDSTERIPVTHQWSDVGISFRRFYGLTRKAPSLDFSINYADYQFKVPMNNTSRPRLKSSGIRLDFLGRWPTTPNYAWLLGLKVIPRVNHQEIETGVNAKSGTGPETTSIGLMVGGEIVYNRENQFMWSFEYTMEKSVFSNETSLPNPNATELLSGVSAANAFAIFKFGFRWAK